MITTSRQLKHDNAVDAIQGSSLDPALKEDIIDVLGRTLESTNGLTPEEKLQSCTENQFDMMRLFALQIVAYGKHPTNWKDLAIRCRRELMWTTIAGFVMLIFRPELAAMVEHLAGK